MRAYLSLFFLYIMEDVMENKGFLQVYDDFVCEIFNEFPSTVTANFKYNPLMYYIGMIIFGLGVLVGIILYIIELINKK